MTSAATPLGMAVQSILARPILDRIFDSAPGTVMDLAQFAELVLDINKATAEALILIADAIDRGQQPAGDPGDGT